MSIPRVDPKFTMKDLEEEGKRFLAAGLAYWTAAHKAGVQGAVIWIKDFDGAMCVYTRGEYANKIVHNIENQGPTKYFGSMKE